MLQPKKPHGAANIRTKSNEKTIFMWTAFRDRLICKYNKLTIKDSSIEPSQWCCYVYLKEKFKVMMF